MLVLYTLPFLERVYQPHATKVKYVPVLYAHEQMQAWGCSGHSRKRADVADVVQDLLISPWHLSWASFSEHLSQRACPGPAGAWSARELMPLGPALSPGGWKLENKYLGQIYGHTSLSKSIRWPYSWYIKLFLWWLLSVTTSLAQKVGLVVLDKNISQHLLNVTRDTLLPQVNLPGLCFSSLCFSAVPAPSVDEGCWPEGNSFIHGASWW